MQKNRKWRNWIKSINEEELSQLLGAKEKDYKLDDDIDKKTLESIKKIDHDREKKAELKEIPVYRKPAFTFSFTAVMTVFIILTVSIIIGEIRKNREDIDNICIAVKLEGDAVLIDRNKKTQKKLELHDVLNKNSTIKTSGNSSVQISFYNRSVSLITEKSELSVLTLNKQQGAEQIMLKQESGSGIFIPAKIEGSSFFDVYTDALIIKTTGTEFTVDVAENKDTKATVYEGRISVSLNINRNLLNSIIKINYELGTKLEKELKIEHELIKNQELIKDRQITVSYDAVAAINQKLEEIYNNLKSNTFLNREEKKSIEEKNRRTADEIETIFNGSYKIENAILNIVEKKLKITKLPESPGKKLTEKFTSFFTDERNLYLASDSKREIFCINSKKGNIIWEFENEKLKNITAPCIFLNGRLINAGPNYIFIIERNGSPFLIQEIIKGPSFWAAPVNINNKIYIPGFEEILIYEASGFSKLKNFSKSPGQLYITAYNNKLFCTYSASQKITIYDLEKEEHIWTSGTLENKIFMPVLVTESNMFFADDTDSFHKYNYTTGKQEKIFIGTGVISNLILRDSYIYFIANNGWFCRINMLSFKKADKLFRADNNPNPDKYMTKKILLHNNEIYFSSDTGKLFKHDIINEKSELINIDDNKQGLPLIASPVKIDGVIYVIDIDSNIYRVNY